MMKKFFIQQTSFTILAILLFASLALTENSSASSEVTPAAMEFAMVALDCEKNAVNYMNSTILQASGDAVARARLLGGYGSHNTYPEVYITTVQNAAYSVYFSNQYCTTVSSVRQWR